MIYSITFALSLAREDVCLRHFFMFNWRSVSNTHLYVQMQATDRIRDKTRVSSYYQRQHAYQELACNYLSIVIAAPFPILLLASNTFTSRIKSIILATSPRHLVRQNRPSIWILFL